MTQINQPGEPLKPIAIETDTERLEIAIMRSGLRKYQVAQRASINGSFLSQILKGSQIPSRAQCAALAEATGMTVTKLFPDTLQEHAMRELATTTEGRDEDAASGEGR